MEEREKPEIWGKKGNGARINAIKLLKQAV